MYRFCRLSALVLVFLLSFGCTSTDDTVPLPTQSEVTLPVQAATAARQRVFRGEENAGSLSGLSPLPPTEYTVSDPDNTAGHDTAATEHYFGRSENGSVHSFSVQFQQHFDAKQLDAKVFDSRTDKKRIYLTFDCGYENGNTEKILDVLHEKQVPAAFFCTLHEVESAPDLIARMIREGHIVGNHSVSHADFTTLDRTRMAEEIMGFDAYMRQQFGYSALYFRFPEGRYSDNAVSLAGSLGFSCIFWSAAYADWDTQKQKGADYALQQVVSQLHPGMILLLHSVSADNAAAMADIIDAARAEGYVFCSLEEL